MGKKIKKLKKRRSKKKIDKGKRKCEYEEEIVELNRELAAIWQEVADVELHQKRMLDAYQAVRENFDSIKENLNHDIQIEETKLEALQNRLAWLDTKKQKLAADYEETIRELQADTENSTQTTKTAIEEKKITLKILKRFEDQREEYLKQEEKIAEAEKQLAESQKRELHEEDRKIRQEEAPMRAEAAEKLSSVMEPLLLRLEPAGMEKMKNLKSEENGKLEAIIEKNSCRLWKLVEKFEQLKKTEWILRLEIDYVGPEKKTVSNGNAGTSASVKVAEIEHQATQTDNFVLAKPERIFPLADIENLVGSLLNLEEWVYQKEEFFEQQENIFEMIHEKISQMEKKPKKWFVAGGFDFVKRPQPNRLKVLERHTLYRNLRESSERFLKKWQREIFGVTDY